MKGSYIVHGQAPERRHRCHVLRHPLAQEDSAYLGWDADGHWYPGASKAQAFVFPSFALAQRYAESLMADGLHTWMPVAVDFPSWLPSDVHACRDCGCIESFACPDRCSWHSHDRCSACAKPAPVVSWAVFDRPLDDPNRAVARRYVGIVPTEEAHAGDSIEAVRRLLPAGLHRIQRLREDSPELVECWI
jgi:hypothetical protein